MILGTRGSVVFFSYGMIVYGLWKTVYFVILDSTLHEQLIFLSCCRKNIQLGQCCVGLWASLGHWYREGCNPCSGSGSKFGFAIIFVLIRIIWLSLLACYQHKLCWIDCEFFFSHFQRNWLWACLVFLSAYFHMFSPCVFYRRQGTSEFVYSRGNLKQVIIK